MELPSLTVITPCLNAHATLQATIDSIRAEAYPHLEHIVVDGGSTDGTVEILEAADGVRWISEPDRGLADALNKGIAMASGDIIGELNADDGYEPGALAAHSSVSAPATFFRRETLAETGGFDLRYRISVDYDLQLRIARRHDPLILHRYLASFRMAEGSLSMSGFKTQFREHAEQARRHGAGRRAAVALNQAVSLGIVGTYEAVRRIRRARVSG